GFVLRLENYAIERRGADVTSADDADAAERISAVGTALPGAATVGAFEDHARRIAGGEQTLVHRVETDGGDVLGGQAVNNVLPRGAAVVAAECAFAGRDQELVVTGKSQRCGCQPRNSAGWPAAIF